MRYFISATVLFSLLTAGCATNFSPSVTKQAPDIDSARAGLLYGVDLHRSASTDEEEGTIEAGVPLRVTGAAKQTYSDGSGGAVYQVNSSQGHGWVDADHLYTPEEYRQYKQLLDELRREGSTVIPASQRLSKNSADGITINFSVANISETETVKYIRTTWKLYNEVGDPVTGENSGESVAQVRLTGPIEPMKVASFEAENLWYSSTGTCATLQGIEIEYIDGQTKAITDMARLQNFPTEEFERAEGLSGLSVMLGDPVKLLGDCSYEAQQARD